MKSTEKHYVKYRTMEGVEHTSGPFDTIAEAYEELAKVKALPSVVAAHRTIVLEVLGDYVSDFDKPTQVLGPGELANLVALTDSARTAYEAATAQGAGPAGPDPRVEAVVVKAARGPQKTKRKRRGGKP